MKIYDKIDQIIGNTPLFEIKNVAKNACLKGRVLVKLERFNPAGSIKDRTALYILDDAKERGLITDGATIIEATSGNTGVGLAAIGASRGYKVIITMPDTMSIERQKLLKAYGAEVVLTDGKLGMKGAIEKAEELNRTIENSFIASQFDNGANPIAHYKTTGPEIYADTDGKVDAVVIGVGTGGTLSGVGKYLKEKNKNVKVIGVEPLSSPLISGGVSGAHKIQGIGANFIPKNFDESVCDCVMPVSDADAYRCTALLAKREGLLVGISSGATLSIALDLAKKSEYEGKIIVAVLADTGERYLSTDVFD